MANDINSGISLDGPFFIGIIFQCLMHGSIAHVLSIMGSSPNMRIFHQQQEDRVISELEVCKSKLLKYLIYKY